MIDHRYSERGSEPWQRGPTGANVTASSSGVAGSKTSYGSNGASSNVLGNGIGISSGGSSWSGNGSTQQDRWNSSSSSMAPVARSMTSSGGFSSSWSGPAPPLNSSVYPSGSMNMNSSVIGQSGTVGYSGDRYSRH